MASDTFDINLVVLKVYFGKYQWCGLRPSVLGQDRSETKKIGLGSPYMALNSLSVLMCR